MQKHLKRGFLPEEDPLESLGEPFAPWETTANTLPKLLVARQCRVSLERLSPFPTEELKTAAEYERAMQILSYFGHAYIWGEREVPHHLPAVLAQPWYQVSRHLGRQPVLSYASYALNNWKRIDTRGPIDLGNIVLIQNFLGGIDEEWFILVHVAIEAKASAALHGCLEAIAAEEKDDLEGCYQGIRAVAMSLEELCRTLDRMPERCDPYIYYHRVRPYIHGWKDHPSFPEGLIYEGVEEYKNHPQKFRGETGAQSSIIPTMDAFLGITHALDGLYHYLQEMREYMPPEHREFIAYVEKKSQIRSYVQRHMSYAPHLRDTYNACIQQLYRFRNTHLSYASHYIQKQHQASKDNPHAVGTGGTPFMSYLKKHYDETIGFLL